jgi:hypothetical protein
VIRPIRRIALCFTLIAAAAAAQNRLAHYDGTPETVSRGTGALADTKMAIQRVPADLACGATHLREVFLLLQDQNTTTPEAITVQVRRNNPATPGTPDLSAAGILFTTTPLFVPFPGASQIEAIQVAVQFPPPGVLLPAPQASPAGDWYLCVILPPAPTLPADGLLLGASASTGTNAGEQMDPTKAGYTGVANQAGLGLDYNVTTNLLALGTANRSWHIIGRYTEDTLQASASSPAFTGTAGTGANPNYGYAGIFPNLLRVVGGVTNADDIGFRVLSSLPVGSACTIAASLGMLNPPFSIGAAATSDSALLCIDPASLLILQTVLTVAPPTGEPATSQALFGPFDGTGLNGFGTFFFQAATVVGSQVKLTTSCKIVL